VKGAARNIVFGNGDERDGDIDDGGAEVRAPVNHPLTHHTHTHASPLIVPAASQTSLSKEKNAAPSFSSHLFTTSSHNLSPPTHTSTPLSLSRRHDATINRRCWSASATACWRTTGARRRRSCATSWWSRAPRSSRWAPSASPRSPPCCATSATTSSLRTVGGCTAVEHSCVQLYNPAVYSCIIQLCTAVEYS
jgi:hypothetical protein